MLQLTSDGQLELQQQLSIPALALPTALQVQSKFSICSQPPSCLAHMVPAIQICFKRLDDMHNIPKCSTHLPCVFASAHEPLWVAPIVVSSAVALLCIC